MSHGLSYDLLKGAPLAQELPRACEVAWQSPGSLLRGRCLVGRCENGRICNNVKKLVS
jgi:hypothetical protein